MSRIVARAVGTLAAVATAAALLAAGPRPIPLATEHTGDEAVAGALAEHATRGEHELSAFVYDGGTVRFGGLGADENAEMEIGSVTKTFNAELLRQQIAEGRISLDTRIGDLLDIGAAPAADIRMEELVNHTSGLSSMEGLSVGERLLARVRDGGNAYRRDTPQDILDAAATARPSKRGERHYSNYGQALLGQLLARNVGTDYATLLRTRILEPAGMTSTRLATPGSVADAPRGLGPGGHPAEPWDMDGWAPAGAIRSTASDMAKYVGWIAEHGRPDYGWSHHDFDGTEYTYHNGGTGGFRTMLVWDPDAMHPRAAFVGNSSSAWVDRLGVDLLIATKEDTP